MAVNLSALAGAGQQFFDNNGVILSGGKLYSYAAGTTTPQATYTSVSGATAHTNPIVLDSAGRIATGEIWVTAGSNYKFALYTSANVLITTWDNITGINGTGIATNALNVGYDPVGTGAVPTTVQAKLRESVSVKDFGAVCNSTTDDTVAVQNAINYCNTNNIGLIVPGICLISSSININRAIDALSSNIYLEISSTSNGGFTTNLAINLFSTTLAGAQAVEFNGITFTASSNATATYVLDSNKFIRTKFVNCNFIYVKLLNSLSPNVVQSIYLFNNNIRRFTGTFFTSAGTTPDCKFIGNIVEAGESFIDFNFPVGCTLQGNLIEGMSGTAVAYGGAQGLSIVGNYFEANTNDINGRKYTTATSYGVSLIGNSFSPYTTTYSVSWGLTTNCVSMGNYCSINLHNLQTTSNVYINDAAVSNLTNIVGYQVNANPTLTVGTSGTIIPIAMVGGAFATFSAAVMTVTVAPTWGAFTVGSLLTSVGLPQGTFIVSFLSGSGGLGTYEISVNVGTIAVAQSVTSPYIAQLYSRSTPTLALTDNVVPGDYGGAIRGYSVTAQGGYLGLGVINAGAYVEAITVGTNTSVAIGGLLAVNASDGHFSIPTTAGAPSGGAPNFKAGTVPLQYDITNNKLWVYNGGWKSVTLT